VTKRIKSENFAEIRFGGGRNTRASPDGLDPRECTDGANFVLDPGNDEFRPRAAFDLVGQVPNGSEIRGFVTLRKTDGTVSMLVQGGTTVYEWDGSTFSAVGTVDSTAKIRGHKHHFWPLTDKVLITDLGLAENLSSWDGTTYQEESLFQKDGSTVFSNFRAKYCVVENERAIFANLKDNGTALPHVITGTTRGDFATLIDTGQADADRPQSSLSEDAPFYIPMPQLRPINGLALLLRDVAVSQEAGAFEIMTGSTAKDFALEKMHPGSGAVGDESVASTSNDVIYGAPGHIESLRNTAQYGDMELDDPSFPIANDIKDYDDWTLVYNARNRRVYAFAEGETNECHVLFVDFLNTGISPWSKFTTNRSFAFSPSCVMPLYDPADGLEYIFMGDSSGNVYRLEGTSTGDAGDTDIVAFRETILIPAPVNAKAYNLNGYIKHRKNLSAESTLLIKYAGEHANDAARTVTFDAVSYDTLYGATSDGSNEYYGIAQENRLIRRTWEAPGYSNEFQIRCTVEGSNDFAVNSIGVHFDFSA
jgi:hypothetical protein